MLKYCLIVIYGILCVAAADINISKKIGKDKSVSLAVETVLEIDKEIKDTGVKILNKVKNFIGDIKHVFENKNISRRNINHEKKNLFTNFIVNLLRNLIKYKDSDLEYLVLIVNSELQKRRGSLLDDETVDSDILKVLADKFATVKNKPAHEIRHYLKALSNKLSDEKYLNKEEKELLDIINSMCKEDSVSKFNQFIKDIDNYRLRARKNIDLQQLVKEGIQSILYEPIFLLRVDLKSNVTSRLHNYLKSYYDRKKDDSKYTTNAQTVSDLRTPSQSYMENILDLSALKQYYESWVHDLTDVTSSTTQITQRPHSVSVTRKAKYESTDSDDDTDDSDDVKPNKKHKDSVNTKYKTISKKYATMLKKRIDETSEEDTTLRQLYVENNLDLKYDPFGYGHSTIGVKEKKKIRTLSTIRRPYTDPLLERSKLKRIKKQDSETFDESNEKFDDIDSDSTDLSQFTSKKVTSSKYTGKPERFERTLNDNFEPEFRSQKKSLSLRTLRPKFVTTREAVRSRKSKAGFAGHRSEYKMRSDKRGSYEDKELYTVKPGLPNVIELVTDIGYSINIKKDKDLDLWDQKPEVQSSRYSRGHYRKQDSRTFRGRRKPVNSPSIRRQERDSLKPKPKISNHKPIYHRYNRQHNVRRLQYRRYNTEVPIKGLSLVRLGDVKHKRNYRRNNNAEITVNDDSKLLERLKHLENEMDIIKTQINNDTNVEDPVPQLDTGVEPKTVGIESTVKVRSINNDNYSSKGTDLYEKAITEQISNLNQQVKVTASRSKNKFNTDKDLSFITTTLQVDDANQLRKYFIKSEIKEISQLDEGTKKLNDSYSLNTTHINHSQQEDVKKDLPLNTMNEMERDQKVDNNGIVYRGRYDDSTSMPKATVELEINNEVFQRTHETTYNLLDLTTGSSKLKTELMQENGGQLTGLSNVKVENRVRDGITENEHSVLNLASTQSVINDTILSLKSSPTVRIA